MGIGILGLPEQALKVCEERAVLLSNNLVNSATPHYKARDIDFAKTMQDTVAQKGTGTDQSFNVESEIQYRVPMQKSLDGNTVDAEIDRKNFIENALRYEVNLTFMQNKADEIVSAIKGE